MSSRYNAAGTQTTKAPAIGIIDIRNMTTPQSSGDGRPSRKKISEAEHALDRRDGQHAVDGRADHLARADHDVVRLLVLERHDVVERAAQRLGVAEEVEHREDDEQRLHQRVDDAADEHQRRAGDGRAPGLQVIGDVGVRAPRVHVDVLAEPADQPAGSPADRGGGRRPP